jgi:3-hydroxymyristoyl/3-hydroxydecanoyl-(acyl carrier protein) dehydratase
MSAVESRASLRIDATHPALPGHFPGDPVVPGVVLLDAVADALARDGGGALRRLASVKFLAPLRPGQAAELVLLREGTRLRFRIERDGAPVLAGEGECDGGAA